MNKKLIIGIITGVILLIGGYFVFSKKLVLSVVNRQQNFSVTATPTISSIDTSDWKTYRNDEYGFEFKYPVNQFILSTKNTDGDYFRRSGVNDPFYRVSLRFAVSDEGPCDHYGISGVNENSAKKLVLANGTPFYRFKNTATELNTCFGPGCISIESLYLTLWKSQCYFVVFLTEAHSLNHSDIETAFEQLDIVVQNILSTFKFIK